MNTLGINTLLYVYILLFPALVNIFGDAKAGQRLIHVVTIPLLFLLFLSRRRLKDTALPGLGVFAFVFLVVAYYLSITIYNTQEIELGGLLDTGRPLIYLAYLLIPFGFRLTENEFPRFIRILMAGALLQIAFSALVYFPQFDWLQDVFKGRPSNDPVKFHYYRWSGTMAWPSDFSFYLSLFLYYGFLKLLHSTTSHEKLKAALICGLLAFGCVMTMSRGGLATIAIMLAVAVLIEGRIKYGLILFSVGAIAVATLQHISEGPDRTEFQAGYVLRLLDAGIDADASTGHRINELSYALDVAWSNFPFGIGPDRAAIGQHVRVVESLYGHHLIKWGFAGLSLFLIGTVYTYVRVYKSTRRASRLDVRLFGTAALLWAASVPLIFGWSSAMTDRFKCLPFYYFIIGHLWALRTSVGRPDSPPSPALTVQPTGPGGRPAHVRTPRREEVHAKG